VSEIERERERKSESRREELEKCKALLISPTLFPSVAQITMT
jgi:hypothetical protein